MNGYDSLPNSFSTPHTVHTSQPLGQYVQQGGPQMSENGEKIKAINFLHLKNTLKVPKNTDLENIESTYSPRT